MAGSQIKITNEEHFIALGVCGCGSKKHNNDVNIWEKFPGEMWPLSLRMEHKLQVFVTKVFRETLDLIKMK
jgi:hypothetical protein